jgi:hypothetical protein
MRALEDFDTTITLCFTPPSRGKAPNCTSPPLVPSEFAEFATAVAQRYVLNQVNGGQGDSLPATMLAGG